jgi:isoquinoline 1-oxidoreductase
LDFEAIRSWNLFCPDRKDLPSAGAGETPIVCVAPAIGNAIFQATGVRLRSLPMAPQGVVRG